MEKNPEKTKNKSYSLEFQEGNQRVSAKAAKKKPPDDNWVFLCRAQCDKNCLAHAFWKVCEVLFYLLALYIGLKVLAYFIVALVTFFCGPGRTKTTIVEVDINANKSGVWMSSDYIEYLREIDDYYANLFNQSCSAKRDGFRYFYRNDLFTLFHVFISLHFTEYCLFSDSIVFLKPMFRRRKLM